MTATSITPERLFCPKCGQPGVYDATGEADYYCPACKELVDPIRERHLQTTHLIQLMLENERLRATIQSLLAELK